MSESVIITGATGYIGSATVRCFLEREQEVIATVRNAKAKDFLTKNFPQHTTDSKLRIVLLDAENISDGLTNLATLLDQINLPGALINIAATDSWDPIENLCKTVIDEVLHVNLIAPMLLSALMIKYWKKARKSGSIVHISSLLAQFGASDSSAYSASKGGLESFSRCIAIEEGSSGIRSNIVRVSGCSHKLTPHHVKRENYVLPSIALENSSTIASNIPLKKKGTLRDYVEAIYFLTSENAQYITGQILTVDGGISVLYPAYTPPSGKNK